MASKVFDTRRITSKTLHRLYVKTYPDSEVTYKKFKKIVGDMNKAIVEGCLVGGIYDFGHNVGSLSVVKYHRKPYLDEEGKLKGVKPDYNATKKAKAAGKDIVIYHQGGLTCKWHWSKRIGNRTKLANINLWALVPTDGPKGISRKLHHHIEANPRCTIHYREIVINSNRIIEDVKRNK